MYNELHCWKPRQNKIVSWVSCHCRQFSTSSQVLSKIFKIKQVEIKVQENGKNKIRNKKEKNEEVSG